MVFAFAGDSTITSDVDPDSGAAPLSSTSGVVFRARGLALALETLLAAVFFLAVLAFAILMHRYVVAVSGRIFQASSLEQSTQLVEGNAPLKLHERALDDVLQLDAVDGARAIERQEMSPCIGGKAPSLVRSHHSERGLSWNSFVHLR